MAKKSKKQEAYESDKPEEFVYDEVTGARGKKSALSVLNKRTVGNHEMDELFCDWG